MSYTQKIQRYQRLSPDIQTEWGTFTNPHIISHPNEMKYRQPGVPMLATQRADVIHPRAMGPQSLGYVGDYVPGPMGEAAPAGSFMGLGGDTLKTVLILAAVGFVLYLLLKPKKAQSNPCVSDFNALLHSGWEPPAALGGGSRSSGGSPRRGMTRAARKRQSRISRYRRRNADGTFAKSE